MTNDSSELISKINKAHHVIETQLNLIQLKIQNNQLNPEKAHSLIMMLRRLWDTEIGSHILEINPHRAYEVYQLSQELAEKDPQYKKTFKPEDLLSLSTLWSATHSIDYKKLAKLEERLFDFKISKL